MFLEIWKTLIHKTVDKYSPELYKTGGGDHWQTWWMVSRTWLLSLLLQKLHSGFPSLHLLQADLQFSGQPFQDVCPWPLSSFRLHLFVWWFVLPRTFLGLVPPLATNGCLAEQCLGLCLLLSISDGPLGYCGQGAGWEAQEILNHHGAALSSYHSTNYCSCYNYTCNPADWSLPFRGK